MDKKYAERNVWLYYVFSMFQGSLILGPILITYITNVSKMTLSEIYFMESIAVMEITLLQIPTGALADYFGRKKIIIAGAFLLILEQICMFLASCKSMIWISNNIFWVIGFSLISGADSSFMYDNLISVGREKEFRNISGKAKSYLFASMAIFSVLSGYLAEINLRIPSIINISTAILALVAVLFFIEPPKNKLTERKDILKIIKEGVLLCATNKKILWLSLFTICISIPSKLWFFTYNKYFELVSIPLRYFGWIFFTMNVTSAITSRNSEKISKILGEKWSCIAHS